jgi:hypothetical protein
MVKGLTAKGRRALDEAKRVERLIALKTIYDCVGDRITEAIPVEQFAATLELTVEDVHALLDYFNDKGYLGNSNQVDFSHAGIVEAERIIKEEKEALRTYGAWSREDEVKVRERETRRFRVLRHLYESSGSGNLYKTVSTDELQKTAGLSEEEWWSVFDYLVGEKLIAEAHSGAVTITARGVDEIEQAERRPDKATAHFSPQVTQIFHGAVGAVQTVVLRKLFRSIKVTSHSFSGGNLKERSDKLRLSHRITSCQPFDLTLPHHVHRFNAFERPLSSMKPLEAL